jgi:putative membrane protein
MMIKNKHIWIYSVVFFSVFIWSGIAPKERLTWGLEIFPAMGAIFVLALTYRKFPLTPLAYTLILLHCCILFVGGHYTYAENPWFEALKNLFHLQRNHYDKLGHLAQGFVPAILAREVILRLNVVQRKTWVPFFCVCIVMFISSFYELFEWWTAVLIGQSADAFLGTQGYAWDTQSDMFFALIGSITALMLLSRLHDRQIQKLHST